MLVEDCLSCNLLAGKLKAPGGVIYEDNYWIVEHSLSPILLRGYLIIKLKRHLIWNLLLGVISCPVACA